MEFLFECRTWSGAPTNHQLLVLIVAINKTFDKTIRIFIFYKSSHEYHIVVGHNTETVKHIALLRFSWQIYSPGDNRALLSKSINQIFSEFFTFLYPKVANI